ncbi:hypothetical protein ACWGJ2_33150 [Streptomyces sp. NPDC054796]
MSQLVSEQTMEVRIEFHHFCLQEAEEDLVPVPYPDGPPSEEFLTSYQGRVDVTSGGHTHTAPVTAQIWDGPPDDDAPPGGVWEAQGTTEIYSETGELVFHTVGGPALEPLELGTVEQNWGLRIFSAGRAEAARATRDGVAHEVERYLLQFWPAPSM